MNRDEVFNEFSTEFNFLMSRSDKDGMHKKHLSAKYSFSKFFPVVFKMKTLGYSEGADFGCGNGSVLMLGKILGVDIEGVDIPAYSKGRKNFYFSLQNNMNKLGYKIHHVKDNIYPFQPDSLGFITSYLSINDDYSEDVTENHMSSASDRFITRMKNLIDALKNYSTIYVGPIKKFNSLKNCISKSATLKSMLQDKNVNVLLWPEKKLSY